MVSESRPEDRHNWSDNVFTGLSVGPEQASLFTRFIASHDFAANTRRAMAQDIRKFARWFSQANQEPFVVGRVTTRDVTDFKDRLRREQQQAVATVNRTVVTLRRYFGWLSDQGVVASNVAKPVKELHRQQLAPKGLSREIVRRLLREIELRQDNRAGAIFALFLYTGGRISDLVNLELNDLLISERSGSVLFRLGKGNKQRSVPLPLPARRAVQAYLESRPPVPTNNLFVGERGPLGDKGIRSLCDKYSAIIGVKIHPHLLRHTMAHRFLEDNPGDLVALAQILGHENLNTTRRYVERSQQQLDIAAENMRY